MKKFIFFTLAIILIVSMGLISCSKATTTTAPAPATTTAPAPATTTAAPPPATTTAAPPPATTTAAPPPATAAAPVPMKPTGGKNGGRLQLQAGLDINNIGDPSGTAGPSDAAYSFLCIEPLFILDKNGNLVPWLASGYTPAADGSSLTITLRQGINFTDGTPFNADVAKWNIDNNGINSAMWPNMKSVQDCVVVDPYTIRLDFVGGKWNWTAVSSLAGFWSCCMFDPTSLQSHDATWKHTHVVGTGPFILTNYVQDQKLSYDANPNYWRGAPYLQGIDYNIIPDATTALLAYKANTIDSLGVQPKDAAGLIAGGFSIIKTYDMVFNLCMLPSSGNPNSPLQDIRIRQAIESSIDKQALVKALTYGYGVATNQEFCLPPYMDPTTVGYSYNPARVKNLLAQAGYPNGFTTTLYYVQGMPNDLPLAIQGQLANNGITLKLVAVGYIQFVNMIQGGQGWDGYVFSYGFPGTTVDPASTLSNGPLNAISVNGTWKVTTWDSCAEPDELCNLFAQSNQETDHAKRVADIQEISRLMTDKYCMWSFFYYTPALTSIAPYVQGCTIGQDTEWFPYDYCWLNK